MRLKQTLVAATAALALAVPPAASAWETEGGHLPIFLSYTALVAGDTDLTPDIYVRTPSGPRLITDGTATESASVRHVSADGSVAYYHHDGILRVRTAAGVKPVTPAKVEFMRATPDGAKAYLQSEVRMHADDTDDLMDVYEYSLATGAMRLISKNTDADEAYFEFVDAAGTMVFFTTGAKITGDDLDSSWDIFVAVGDARLKVSPGNGAVATEMEALAADGRMILSTSEALVAGDTDTKVDIYSTTGGTPALLTPSPNAAAAAKPVTFVAAAAADAARVLFKTEEKLVPGDTDATADLYATEAGKITLLTAGVDAFLIEDVSDDAEVALFSTASKMLPTDTDAAVDMYLNGDGGPEHLLKANGAFDQWSGTLSPDGAVAAFDTAEPALPGDGDELIDVYAHTEGATKLVSGAVASKSAQLRGILSSGQVMIGTFEQLLPQDRNAFFDTYGVAGGQLTMISADEFAPDTTLAVTATEGFTGALAADDIGTFECRVDGGAWAACADPWAVGPLPDGEHVLEARAIDASGNVDASPASQTVTVGTPAPPVPGAGQPGATTPAPDTQAPSLTGAKLHVRRRVPALTFGLSEAAKVRVTVQRRSGRRWKALRTTTLAGRAGANRSRLAKLPRRGTFRVVLVATDAAGNASAKVTRRPARR